MNERAASDVRQPSAKTSSSGWDGRLPNALAAIRSGETVEVPARAVFLPGRDVSARVTLMATSESDPDAAATAVLVHVRDTTPGVVR